jgi:hypothetical protein
VCLLAFAVVPMILGCAAQGPRELPGAAHARVILDDVPFFPQDAYQCGPAALAMVLVDSAVETTPDALVERVYVPARRGSLQPELVATARGHDRVPYVIAPSMEALVAEVDAGRPVLVLQNLAFARFPQWHYAVVVGYDRDARRLVLHSGVRAFVDEPLHRFYRTWAGGGYWGMVLLAPGELPASAEPDRLLAAVAPFEELGRTDIAAASYAAMAERWPDHPAVLFGRAHTDQLDGRMSEAQAGYLRLLAVAGPHPAVLNNLSLVQLEMGCVRAAHASIQRAIALVGNADAAARAMLESSRTRIEAALHERADGARAGESRNDGTGASDCPRMAGSR